MLASGGTGFGGLGRRSTCLGFRRDGFGVRGLRLLLGLCVLADSLGRDERLAVAHFGRGNGVEVDALLFGQCTGCGRGEGLLAVSALCYCRSALVALFGRGLSVYLDVARTATLRFLGSLGRLGGRTNVAFGHATARTAAVDGREVDVEFPGEASDARRGEHAPAGFGFAAFLRGRCFGFCLSLGFGCFGLFFATDLNSDDDVADGDHFALFCE